MAYPIIGGSAMWDVQAGVFALMMGDVELREAVGENIFDGEPPEDANVNMPFVCIGEITEVPNDRLTTTGNDLTILFHVYSNYEGNKEILLIGKILARLLTYQKFPVQGFVINSSRPEFHQVLSERDGVRHALYRYRIKVQPIG
jgi:hypothetical protein